MSEPTGMRTFHMCVDIEGVLRYSDAKLSKFFVEDDGSHRSGQCVRDWLRLQLAQGKRVLPVGSACVGFSYLTGCPGHRVVDGVQLTLEDPQ